MSAAFNLAGAVYYGPAGTQSPSVLKASVDAYRRDLARRVALRSAQVRRAA